MYKGSVPLCLMLGLDVQPRSKANDERLQAEGSQFRLLKLVASSTSLDDLKHVTRLSPQTASRNAEHDAGGLCSVS
jgi:hypothetical protein